MNNNIIDFNNENKPDFLMPKRWEKHFAKLDDRQVKTLIMAIFQLNRQFMLDKEIHQAIDEDQICSYLYEAEIVPYVGQKIRQYRDMVEQKRKAAGVRWDKHRAEQGEDENEFDGEDEGET